MRRRGRYEGKEVLEDRNTGKESPKANEVKEANDKGEWKDGGGGVISSSLTPPPPQLRMAPHRISFSPWAMGLPWRRTLPLGPGREGRKKMLVEDADVVFNLLNHIYTYRVCANIHINTYGYIIFYLPFSPTFLLANYLFIFLICLFVSGYLYILLPTRRRALRNWSFVAGDRHGLITIICGSCHNRRRFPVRQSIQPKIDHLNKPCLNIQVATETKQVALSNFSCLASIKRLLVIDTSIKALTIGPTSESPSILWIAKRIHADDRYCLWFF